MIDLEREYSPSSRAGGSAAPHIAAYQARSAAAVAQLGDRVVTLPGGTQWVDGGPGTPLLVFVHGGYWQALSAADSMFLAPAALALGWSYAAVEYTIAPEGTVAGMVGECRDALAALARVSGPRRVVLAGHSAGAHLAAMVSLADVSPLPVERVVLVSGVFDLRPLVLTTVNEPLGLDDTAAASLSPTLLPVVGRPAVMVTWGDDDTDAFKAQSAVYAARLRAAGLAVSELECAGHHHFSLVDLLVDPSHPMGAFALGGIR